MKDYHTEIVIEASRTQVWTVLTDFEAYPEWNPLVGWLNGDFRTGGAIRMFISPLGRAFDATLGVVEQPSVFSWVGVQVARWFLSGEHLYRLETTPEGTTRLFHGEQFRGLASATLSSRLLKRMEATFVEHNLALKARVEAHG